MKIKIFAWALFLIFFLIAAQASQAVIPFPTKIVSTQAHDTAVQNTPNVFSLGNSLSSK